MKKRTFHLRWGILWVGALLICALSGCSQVANERQIIEDLQLNRYLSSSEFEIYDHEIIKRQTDKGAKTDLVWVNVDAKNEWASCNRSFKMTYILYNDGWRLEEMEPFEEEAWTATPLCGTSDIDVQNTMATLQRENEYASIELVDRDTDLEAGIDTVTFRATKNHLYAVETVELVQSWYFSSGSCFFETFGINSEKHIFTPSDSLAGAAWAKIPRYADTYDLFVDTFDLRILAFDGEQITLEVTKNDTAKGWWEGLDSPPQTTAQVSTKYWGCHAEYSGMICIPLDDLTGELYPYHSDDDFDSNDYFFFDLDSNQGKIVTMYGNAYQEIEWRKLSSGLTQREEALETAMGYAKELGINNCYDEGAPICGIWILTYDEGAYGIWCISANGLSRTYWKGGNTIYHFGAWSEDFEAWKFSGDVLTFGLGTNPITISWTSDDSFDAQYEDGRACSATRIYF